MMPEETGSVRRAAPVRGAIAAGAAELTRLRALMYESFGGDASGGEWRATCVRTFARRLAEEPEEFVAFVVDADGGSGPGGPLVASGVGWVEVHLPGPTNLTGRRGHIASMSTDLEAR